MWSSDSGITEFTVILSKHVFYLYDQTSQSQFYPNNKQPGSSEMDCQCELALPHRRGGLRASCSCLTHLSGSSTLSLRKRRTRDTRSSFLLFVSMIPQWLCSSRPSPPETTASIKSSWLLRVFCLWCMCTVIMWERMSGERISYGCRFPKVSDLV